jgi:hypothetical protein
MVAPIIQRVVLPGEGFVPSRILDLPATGGLKLSELDVKLNHVHEFEKLVTFLLEETSRDAPIFLLANEPMALFLTKRATLFPDRAYYLFLLSWDMLPEVQRRGLDVEEMLERLKDTPEAIVVYRPDPSSDRLLAALPGMREFIAQKYEVMTRVDWYFIFRQKRDPESPPAGSS